MRITFRKIIVILMIIVSCGCSKKEEKVTPDNAECITYDYLYKLAKKEMTEEKVYTYKVNDIFVCYDCEPQEILTKYNVVVEEIEIQNEIDKIVKKYTTSQKVLEGKVKKEDTVNLDILVYEGDKELTSEALKDYEYTLGGELLGELDKKLEGLEIGEVYDIPTTFEKDYKETKFAGKEILFTIKVNYVIKYEAPEVNDELIGKYAKEIGKEDEFDTLLSYKEWITESLKQKKIAKAKEELYEEVWAEIIANSEIKTMPQWDYDTAYNQVINTMKERYEENKDKYSTYEEFLVQYGYNESKLDSFAKKSANKYVTEKLAVLSIAKKNKIVISSEEYENCISEYMKKYNFSNKKDFYNELGKSRNIFILERYYELLYKKVVDSIYSKMPETE